MSIKAGDAVLYLGTDRSKLEAGLRDAKASVSTWASETAATVGNKITDGLKKVAEVAAGALLATGVAGAAIGVKAVQAASDLNESASKSEVVFGEFNDRIAEFAKTADWAFGLTKQRAFETAGTFGNLFVSMGLGKKEAAGMSIDLIKLAGDLASFNNLKIEDVLEKLRAGLIGEAEPMRSVGVLLSEDTMKAKALALGLGDLKGNLTEGEKVQARYAIMLEQTKTAQGDFARTSTGLANSQRILSAVWQNTLTDLGQVLLPRVTGALQNLMPILRKDIVPMLQGGFVNLDKFIDQAGTSTKFFFDAIRAGTSPVSALSMALKQLLPPEMAGQIDQIRNFILPIETGVRNLVGAIIGSGPEVKRAIENMATSAGKLTSYISPQLAKNIGDALTSIANLWTAHKGEILAVVEIVWNGVVATIGGALTLASGALSAGLKILEGDWGGAWETMKGSFDSFNRMVLSLVGTTPEQASKVWADNWGMFKIIVKEGWDKLQDMVSTSLDLATKDIQNWIIGLGQNVMKIKDLAVEFSKAGSALIEGLKEGIKKKFDEVIAWVSQLIGQLPLVIKKALGISSPSAVFAAIGRQSMEGLTLGLQQSARLPRLALAAVSAMPSESRVYTDNRRFNIVNQDALAAQAHLAWIERERRLNDWMG